jgi:hypothetical protein
MSTILAIPAPQGIIRSSTEVIQQAEILIIVDDATYLLAGQLLKAVKSLQAEIEATFDPVIESAHRAHQQALLAKSAHATPLLKTEGLLKNKILQRDNVLRMAKEQADREQRESERKAREEQETAERKAREEAAEQKRQAEMALQMALEAEQEGDTQTADELLAEAAKVESIPVVIPKVATLPAPRPLPPPPPKIQGVSSRTVWRWRVKELNDVPRAYLLLNETLLNTVARTSKGQTHIPGIEFFSKQDLSSGRLK